MALGDKVAGFRWTTVLGMACAIIIIFALFAVWPQPTSSEDCDTYDLTCTLTWTTDAQFDAGDKGLNGTDYFTEDVAGLPLVGNPSAYYSVTKNRTYVVYESTADPGSLLGQNFSVRITYYNHNTGVWADSVLVGEFDTDAHGGPTLWVDEARGWVYVFFGSHNTPQLLSRSLRPWEINRGWTVLSPPASDSTYPMVFEWDNYMYMLRRRAFAQGGDWVWQRSKLSTRGTVWSTPQILFDSVAPNGAYFDGVVQRNGTVYYSFIGYNDPFERHDVFLGRWNLTTNRQTGMDNVDTLGTSITIVEAQAHMLVRDTGPDVGQSASNSAFDVDLDGNPHVVWTEGFNNPHFVNYSRWTGAAWIPPVTVTYTDGTTNYQEVFARNTTFDVELIVTTNGSLEIDDGVDDYGGTIDRYIVTNDDYATFVETIKSEGNNGMPVDRPNKPANYHEDLRLVFDEWVPFGFEWGPKQTTQLHIYAWGGPEGVTAGPGDTPAPGRFVRNTKLSSHTWSMQSGSDNSQWSNELQPARVDGDLYNGINTTAADTSSNYFWQMRYGGDGDDDLFSNIGQGGVFVNGTFTGGSGRHESALISRFEVAPTYDLRFGFNISDADNITGFSMDRDICILNQPDTCYTGNFQDGTYGYMFEVIWATDNPAARMNLFAIENGVLGDPVAAVDGNTCNADACYLRVKWNGVTGYLSFAWSNTNDPGDVGWDTEFGSAADGSHFDDPTNQTLETLVWFGGTIFANVINSSWEVRMTPQVVAASMTEFRRSGPVEYQTQGFSAATGPYAAFAVTHVRVGYRLEGGDSIDYVELIDTTSGQVYWSNASGAVDAPSEAFVDFTVPATVHNWKFRVTGTTNATNDDGTLVITSIVLTLTRQVYSQIPLWWLPWLMFFAVMVLILVMAYWLKRKRGL